jgi:hypothetical protein
MRGFWIFTAQVVLAAILILPGTGECQPPTPSGTYLVGTIISKMFTGAVINDAKGEQSFYQIHDTLPDGSQIIKVTNDHISLKGPDGSFSDMFIMQGKTPSHEAGSGQARATASPPVGPPPVRTTAPQNARRLSVGRHKTKQNADQTSAIASPPGASNPNQTTTPRKQRQRRTGRGASSEDD